MGDPERLSFGLVPPPSSAGLESRLDSLLQWVGEHASVELVRQPVGSYDELLQALREGAIHVAWLPPIPYARLDAEGIVRPLVCAERGSRDAFVSVLLSRAKGPIVTIEDARGKHVGWVDPLSTSGYVLPRLRLASRFPSVTTFFGKESFFGSHLSVMKALLEERIDVAATYGGFSEAGNLVRGPYQDLGIQGSDVHVVEAFGGVPLDVIAVHTSLSEELDPKLAAAFEATTSDPATLATVRSTFGTLSFVRKPLVGYDLLLSEIAAGIGSKVIPSVW